MSKTGTIKILFRQPVKMVMGYELLDFSTNTREFSHLLIVNDRHYHLNDQTCQLIRIIEKNSALGEIASEFSKASGINYSENDIIILVNNLLAKKGIVETIVPVEQHTQYASVYFKTTIIPEKALSHITQYLKVLCNPTFAKISLGLITIINLAVFIHYYTHQNINTYFNSPKLVFFSFLIFTLSTIFHELGHASACRYFKAKHGEIGFGLYLNFPVLYARLSDAWRLQGWQRAIIDVAGIYFQFLFNIILFLVYFLTGNDIFIYAIQVIIIQAFLSLNPFLKWDGYWVATDLMGIPNLRKRTFEMLEYLFNRVIPGRAGEKAPVVFSMKKRHLYVFLLYALVSNLFLVFFMTKLFLFLPGLIRDFPVEVYKSIRVLLTGSVSLFTPEALKQVFQILTKTMILGVSLFFVFRILFVLYKKLLKMLGIGDANRDKSKFLFDT